MSCLISSPFAIERSSRRMILPERVLGRLSPKRMSLGLAIAPISLPTQSRSSFAILLALRIAPDGAEHGGPRALDHQDAALALADRVAGFIDDVGDDPGQRQRRRAGLGRYRPRQRRNHVAAGLGLPPGIDDRAAPAPDGFVIPHPGLGVDRLADGAEDAQR